MSDQYEPIKEYWIIRVGGQAAEIKRLTAARDDLLRDMANDAMNQEALNKMTRERDAWRKLVVEHNARCIEECDVVGFGCDGPMRCLDCPLYRCVDIPPELEQSP